MYCRSVHLWIITDSSEWAAEFNIQLRHSTPSIRSFCHPRVGLRNYSSENIVEHYMRVHKCFYIQFAKHTGCSREEISRGKVHECRICFRNDPKQLSQIMGQLPADRVIPKRPFFVTGMDFAGPL